MNIQVLKKLFNHFAVLFRWLYLFYPKAKGIDIAYLLYCFFPQKLLRINGRVPWPVHYTSRVLYHKRIKVGNRCAPGMSSCCYIQGRNGIEIGHNFRLGPGVGLISANHNLEDYDKWTQNAPIKIGNNVWIGMNAVILPGIHVGDNVVIAANSVVTKDIPSNSIVAGNPCTILKKKSPYTGKDYNKFE